MTTGDTHGTAAVLEVVETQRKILRGELRTLDTIAVKLGGEQAEAPVPTLATSRPKSRKGTGVNSPAAAKKRQHQVYDHLAATGGEVAPKAIRDALGMSEGQVRKATQRLEEAGRVRRTGERQHTRYQAVADVPPAGSEEPPAAGTLTGRVLAEIQERRFVTLAELIEASGEQEGVIRGVCGGLIREEEVQMERRGAKRGYVAVGGA